MLKTQLKPFYLLLFALIKFAFISSSLAQTTGRAKGKLILFTEEKETVVKLDSVKMRQNQLNTFIEVYSGNYQIQAWKQGYELYTDSIYVQENGYYRHRIELTRTPEYATYRKQLTWYRIKKNTSRYLPGLLTAIYVIPRLSELRNYDSELDMLEKEVAQAYEAYNNAVTPIELEEGRSNYNKAAIDYGEALDQRNDYAQQTLIIGSIGAAITGYFLYRSFKYEKPNYTPTPALLSRVNASIYPTFVRGSVYSSFQITFAL